MTNQRQESKQAFDLNGNSKHAKDIGQLKTSQKQACPDESRPCF